MSMTNVGPSKKFHATILRAAGGAFLLIPTCVFCGNSAGQPVPFTQGVMLSAAYTCDPCVEKFSATDTSNLALATSDAPVPEKTRAARRIPREAKS